MLAVKLGFGLFFGVAGFFALHAALGEPLPATEGLVVQYKPGVDSDALKPTYEDHGAVETGEIAKLNVDVIKVPPSNQDAIIKDLQSDSRVLSVQPDYRGSVETTVPNDPGYPKQYEWTKMAVDQLWDTTKGNSSLIVAIIDSGVRADHEEFAGRLVAGYDFVNNDNTPDDDNGHGTAVAGVVAAAGNNGVGVAGGCWNCKIMPLKAIDADGSGLSSNFSKAITYAVDHGAKVINMSLSGPDDSTAERTAVDYATSKGVLIVAAAGNQSGTTTRYPAAYPNVISVASTTSDDSLRSDSNYGTNVDVGAPGDSIFTTNFSAANEYANWSGTSFASPAVVAVAALLYSVYPTASITEVSDAMTTTADPCCSNKFPGGRVNAAKALAYLAAKYPVVTPPTPPTPTPPTPPPAGTPKTGDLNNDGKVNLTDLSLLLSNWGKAYPTGDYNKNGKIDLPDLSVLLSNWNK